MLLEIKNLTIGFRNEKTLIKVVENLNFEIDYGEIMGLVGESGCGKSMTALSILDLISSVGGEIIQGEVLFEGRNLLGMSKNDIQSIRGREIAMIFQDPFASLNPSFTIFEQLREVYQVHTSLSGKEILKSIKQLIDKVKIPHSQKYLFCYPHQLSGGMLQRVMIAMALVCKPKLLIADEPTTALDVTIQAEILKLLFELQNEENMSVLLITHDLGVVKEMCHRTAIMYAGEVVEASPTNHIFKSPLHPYTKGLVACTQSLLNRNDDQQNSQTDDDKLIRILKTGHLKEEDSKSKNDHKNEMLASIPGTVPEPGDKPIGCYFNPRCQFKREKCTKEKQEIKSVGKGRTVRCLLYK